MGACISRQTNTLETLTGKPVEEASQQHHQPVVPAAAAVREEEGIAPVKVFRDGQVWAQSPSLVLTCRSGQGSSFPRGSNNNGGHNDMPASSMSDAILLNSVSLLHVCSGLAGTWSCPPVNPQRQPTSQCHRQPRRGSAGCPDRAGACAVGQSGSARLTARHLSCSTAPARASTLLERHEFPFSGAPHGPLKLPGCASHHAAFVQEGSRHVQCWLQESIKGKEAEKEVENLKLLHSMGLEVSRLCCSLPPRACSSPAWKVA